MQAFVRGVTELIDIDPFEIVPTDTTTADTSASVVRIDALRNFRQVVDGLGGDPGAPPSASAWRLRKAERRCLGRSKSSWRTRTHSAMPFAIVPPTCRRTARRS